MRRRRDGHWPIYYCSKECSNYCEQNLLLQNMQRNNILYINGKLLLFTCFDTAAKDNQAKNK